MSRKCTGYWSTAYWSLWKKSSIKNKFLSWSYINRQICKDFSLGKRFASQRRNRNSWCDLRQQENPKSQPFLETQWRTRAYYLLWAMGWTPSRQMLAKNKVEFVLVLSLGMKNFCESILITEKALQKYVRLGMILQLSSSRFYTHFLASLCLNDIVESWFLFSNSKQ